MDDTTWSNIPAYGAVKESEYARFQTRMPGRPDGRVGGARRRAVTLPPAEGAEAHPRVRRVRNSRCEDGVGLAAHAPRRFGGPAAGRGRSACAAPAAQDRVRARLGGGRRRGRGHRLRDARLGACTR